MISPEILDRNLNDQVDYKTFFHAFGYDDPDRIYLRTFDDKGRTKSGINSDVSLYRFNEILPIMRRRNAEKRGVFFVVNGGGQSDKNVRTARAQFIDFDDFDFEEQIRRLNELDLDPSVIVKTRKSLHCYWILDDGDIQKFRIMQGLLIRNFGSDPAIINESRVMRLYGFKHQKTDEPVMVTLIKFDPDLRYTQREIFDRMPEKKLKPEERTIKRISRDQIIPVGQRHNYVVSRIGEFLSRLSDCAEDEAILALVEADFYLHCAETESVDMEDFREKYLRTIKKLRIRHEEEEREPDFYSFAMRAWKDENPGLEFDRKFVSWDEVIAAGHRAKAHTES